MKRSYLNIDLEYELAKQRLIDNIDKKKVLRLETKHNKPFEGVLKNNKFEIRRISNYSKTYLPIINGEIKSSSNGTIVKYEMEMNLYTIIVLIIWFFIFGIISYFIFVTILNMKTMLLILTMLGFIFILVFYSVLHNYKKECKKSKDQLINIFNGVDITS